MIEKKYTTAKQEAGDPNLVFGKKNYQLLLIAMAIVVVGFILMMGTTNIYDFRKTLLAPMVVLAGFVVGIYAVLKR